MIVFDVCIEAHPGKADDFMALAKRAMAASQAEDGCVVYRYTRDLDDPLRFYLLEMWADEAAFQGHARGEPFRAFLAELPGLGKLVSSTPRQGPLEPYVFVRPTA